MASRFRYYLNKEKILAKNAIHECEAAEAKMKECHVFDNVFLLPLLLLPLLLLNESRVSRCERGFSNKRQKCTSHDAA